MGGNGSPSRVFIPAVVDWDNDGRKDLVLGALDGRLIALDAATGALKQMYAGTEYADEILFDAGRLIVSINPPRESRCMILAR